MIFRSCYYCPCLHITCHLGSLVPFASMHMQSMIHRAASSMHCPRLQQQAKWPAHMLQCGIKKSRLSQHAVSVSYCAVLLLHARSLLYGTQTLLGCCRRSTDGKWRQQRLGSRLCMTLGWSIFGVGNLLRFAAMRFAAQMVLSGLGSLQFVMIPVVSNFLLGDKYTWEAFVSIVIILGGAKHALCHCCLACLRSGCCKAVQTCCLPFWHCSWSHLQLTHILFVSS